MARDRQLPDDCQQLAIAEPRPVAELGVDQV